MAGIGAAHIVSAKAKIDCDQLFSLLNRVLTGRDVNLRYYGGLRFTQERKGPARHPLGELWQLPVSHTPV